MPRKQRGRRRGQTSPKIRATARKNGTAGGRPPAKLPKQLLVELGQPPKDVLQRDAWDAELITILMLGVAKGEPWKGILEIAVRAAALGARLRENVIKARLAKAYEAEQREIDEDVAPEETPRDKDPLGAAHGPALRRPAA